MNVNEVLATLAARAARRRRDVHPNDDVNAPLSSNDQFPAAMHMAAAERHRRRTSCPRSSTSPPPCGEQAEASPRW